MKFKKDNRRYIIRLDKGEELIETITKFCDSNKLGFASFNGIGGLKECSLAYFDLNKKEYLTKEFNDEGIFELLSINGNVSLKEGKTFVHAHVVLGKKDYSTIGGHLMKGIVNPTCEIFLIAHFLTRKAINPTLCRFLGKKTKIRDYGCLMFN